MVFTSTYQLNEYCNYYYDTIHEDDLRMQEDMLNPIALVASNNADNLYYQQSMKAPDAR